MDIANILYQARKCVAGGQYKVALRHLSRYWVLRKMGGKEPSRGDSRARQLQHIAEQKP